MHKKPPKQRKKKYVPSFFSIQQSTSAETVLFSLGFCDWTCFNAFCVLHWKLWLNIKIKFNLDWFCPLISIFVGQYLFLCRTMEVGFYTILFCLPCDDAILLWYWRSLRYSTQSYNFTTVFCTVEMPQSWRYWTVSCVLHRSAVEDVQLDVAGSRTQRLHHA
jgi:hypothetical protein